MAERRRIDAGPADAYPAGEFRMIQAGSREIGVIRLRDGSFRAVRNRCPHKGAAICQGIVGGTWPASSVGTLEFAREGEILVCPWHGFEYDLDSGAELFWPKGPGLRLYPTEIIDGRVVVTIPATKESASFLKKRSKKLLILDDGAAGGDAAVDGDDGAGDVAGTGGR